MNIGNCNDIFTLLRCLLPDLQDGPFGEIREPNRARAKLAAMRIADAAHKRLGAGPTGADVERAWALRLEGPPMAAIEKAAKVAPVYSPTPSAIFVAGFHAGYARGVGLPMPGELLEPVPRLKAAAKPLKPRPPKGVDAEAWGDEPRS